MLIRALLLLIISAFPAYAAETVADNAAKIIEKEKVAAIGWFVVGSHASGNVQPHSDIDVLAIVPQLDRSYRQTGMLGQQAYQLSVFGKDKLDAIYESERRNGNSIVMHQIARGKVLKDDDAGTLAAIQAAAVQQYAAGPYPLTPQARDTMCYRNKSWLDDFADDRPKAEADVIAMSLYSALVDFYLRMNRQWSTIGGKWQHRLLVEANSDLAARLAGAYDVYFKAGDKKPLQEVAALAMAGADCDINNYRLVDPPVFNRPAAVR